MPVIPSKVPTPDEVIILNKPLLDSLIAFAQATKAVKSKWALAGDAGEVIRGVNVPADHLVVLTTSDGCKEICSVMERFQTKEPALKERQLEREAEVEGKKYPITIRSMFAELTLSGVVLSVHGDLQIKVGEWDWGDPMEWEPDVTYIINLQVPVFPLRLKSELYIGLGWLDRVEKITEAQLRAQHNHFPGQ